YRERRGKRDDYQRHQRQWRPDEERHGYPNVKWSVLEHLHRNDNRESGHAHSRQARIGPRPRDHNWWRWIWGDRATGRQLSALRREHDAQLAGPIKPEQLY